MPLRYEATDKKRKRNRENRKLFFGAQSAPPHLKSYKGVSSRNVRIDRYPGPRPGAVSGRGHATDLAPASYVAFHTFRICGSVLRRGLRLWLT